MTDTPAEAPAHDLAKRAKTAAAWPENINSPTELILEDCADTITALRTEVERLRAALVNATASLVAAISLLARGGKKAAPSDTMFAMMLADYQKAVDEARAALTQEPRT